MAGRFEQLNPPRYRDAEDKIKQGDATDKDSDARQKPVLTRGEYDQARVILDALPPGYYAKCAFCHGWYTRGRYVHTPDGPRCEGCSNG